MLRAAGVAAVVLSCTAIGVMAGSALSDRVSALRELDRLLTMLKRQIQYASAPLPEAFDELAARCRPPFSRFFAETARCMERRDGKSMEEIFRENVQICLSGIGLSETDLEALVRLGGRLGYLDGEMQVRTISFYQEELAQVRAAAEEEFRQKAKVYRYLGFLGGCFLVLLFV